MRKEDSMYQKYINILKTELVPAMGCTEPIAIAYAAALAQKTLQEDVKHVEIYASGNIIKNVKSVTVPNTNGRKGILAAAAIGICAGDPDKKLQVISKVKTEDIQKMEKFLDTVDMQLHRIQSGCALELIVKVFSEKHHALVHIRNTHANVVIIKHDEAIIYQKEDELQQETGYSLQMKQIYDFAMSVDVKDVEEILERQIAYNEAIANEGLRGNYGAGIGNVLLHTYGTAVEVKARAMAAAGSDARMSGCELPVIINSGSGNQGMTASLPVLVYAKELHSSHEQLMRALIISNLTTLYQKQFIGRLSAYCGAVSAGAGAGAGITYLLGGDYEHICHTIVNALAITSGMLCDGAKPSCAAKIASAVDAGILGYAMYKEGKQFYRGEGIVGDSIEKTMEGIGQLARDGMKECDDEIIRLMIQSIS